IREERLDERICDCCQTSAVSLNGKALAVYRNRTEEEIRDIWMVRFDGENWSSPEKFSEDNWEIAGCPVNGPSIDASGNQVAVAWFTGAGGIMKVKLKISNDEGKTFGSEILVNDGNPAGRVDLVFLEEENIAVSWIETSGEEDFLRLKVFDKMGQTLYSHNLTPISSSRKSGFPRMISAGENQLIFAWTDIETNSIRTAAIKLDL
ncbi:MAG: glycoside hydrolase, partial [Cyclobacteriaceae bacterium]|nr:glycoside hydrolase [Cyclobacteriaceae bacterium]